MKPSISSSGVSVSGSVGGQKGSVGIGSNGTVNIGIDFGGIKLGVTNDYGGAGTIGFGGQSITWGPEGGNIKLGIGGFDVKVEARNCVVVETKTIAGMIVSQRSYPDPGCKSVEPESKNLNPNRPTPNGINPNGFPTRKKCQEDGEWIMVGNAVSKIDTIYGTRHEAYDYPIEEALARRITYLDGGYTAKDELFDIKRANAVWGQGNWHTVKRFKITANLSFGYWLFSKPPFVFESGRPAMPSGIIASWGTLTYSFYIYLQKGLSSPSGSYYFTSGAFEHTLVIDKLNPPPPCLELPQFLELPSAGNRPPMPESCCESLKADIEDIKEVLAVKEMLAGKLTFPWRLRMPGGEGQETIFDYPNLARCLAQMIDHLGIHPPKLSIKDINNAVAGDQSIENQFPSGTQAFEALMAQVWDANADVDTLTNFLYRLSWLSVQQSMNLARVSGDVQCIKDMFGGETEPAETSITTPFNIGAGVEEKAPTQGKGFGKKPGVIDQSIEANTELSTEKLLPAFLRIRENPIIVQAFTGNKDVFDFLAIIILKLEKLENR